MAIPVLRADMASLASVRPYLRRIEQSGYYSNYGPLESELRCRYSELLKIPTSRLCTSANATLAIQGLASLSSVDLWKVQDWSFPATAHGILQSRTPFEFVDVDPITWLIDTGRVPTLNPHFGYVLVTPFGMTPDIPRELSQEVVILDSAASLGNLTIPKSLNERSAVVFSMHATKPLGCGEGSLVVCGSESLAEEFRSWCNFGFNGSRSSEIAATNAKLSEIHAAFALANLDEFDKKREEYLALRAKINQISSEFDLLPKALDCEFVSPYWIVELQSPKLRAKLELAFSNARIETRRWWLSPQSKMSAFASFVNPELDNRNSADLAERTLGLPFSLQLSTQSLSSIRRTLELSLANDDIK